MTEVVLLLIVAIIVGFAVYRLERARRRFLEAQQRLEFDIETMSAEIYRRFEVVAEAERQQMLDDERNRIMRDVHDGLGGLLIQAISVVERDGCGHDLQQILNLALTDLRLIVDSLSPSDNEFASLIASFRHLYGRASAGSSCHYDWNIDDLSNTRVDPPSALYVLRIIQEAVTNIEKHSQATSAVINIVASGSGGVVVTVKDNGVGFDPQNTTGRGLPSMRRRAAELGADLSIRSSHNGTAISLLVPAMAPHVEQVEAPTISIRESEYAI